MKPFLKWPGGKRWLSESLGDVIGQIDGRYIEPFLGGASLYFHLQPNKAILSDANEKLIETYLCIRRAPNAISKRLAQYQELHSKDFYYAERARTYSNSLDRAAQFLYLNRTCFNGIYRVNLRGEFNVPKGNKTKVILPDDDFSGWSSLLKSAEICHSDFEVSIDKAMTGDVIFADPPYTVQHNTNGFIKYNENLFAWSDQIRLSNALARAADRGARVFSTNANHSSLSNLYTKRWYKFELSRSSVIAGKAVARNKTSELLISNSKIDQFSDFCIERYEENKSLVSHKAP